MKEGGNVRRNNGGMDKSVAWLPKERQSTPI